MTDAAEDYDSLYLQGIAYFNACEFFEAHEVWEDLWKSYSGDLRLFYKGLIQAAVALHPNLNFARDIGDDRCRRKRIAGGGVVESPNTVL